MTRFFRRKKEVEQQATDGDQPVSDIAATDLGEPQADPTGDQDGAAAPVEEAVERTRRTWFGRIGGMFRKGLSEELWEELEETLVAADTGVATTLKVIDDVKEKVRKGGVKDPDEALGILKEDLVETLEVDTGRGRIWHSNGHKEALPKPAIILVVGVNGTGKTTSIGKLAHIYKSQGKKLVLAAADTFRAAAIDQLKRGGNAPG